MPLRSTIIVLSLAATSLHAGVDVEAVSTDVAAFIGLATKGPMNDPIAIGSFGEFIAEFGAADDALANPWLAPSVEAFFGNGGRRCWVVRASQNSNSAYRSAIDTLRVVDEVSIIAAPGATSIAVQDALIAQAEQLGDRLAILDSSAGIDVAEAIEQRQRLGSDLGYGAFYYPWLRVDSTGSSLDVIPPCGFVAGVMASTDAERGVWRSPVGVVRGATGLERELSTPQQGELNVENVNPIVFFPGRGINIWGARTLSTHSEWQYVPVRRLASFMEESIHDGTSWAVFEPNDARLWGQLRKRIGLFMSTLFRSGAFQGASPSDAYFVNVDHTTMTQGDIDEGRTIAIVGFAAVRPAEFVILRIVHERSSGPVFLRGDCNDDGKADVSDAVCTLEWLFLGGSEPGCVSSANTNGDSGVDLSDAVALLSYLFLGGAPPVAPFPSCGEGTAPADEQLGCAQQPSGC